MIARRLAGQSAARATRTRSSDETVQQADCIAELFGTFWLVFGGCGSAVLAARFIALEGATPLNLGIGLVGVSLAFGLTVLTMAYAIGHISGCHLNPAVSVGLCIGGRFRAGELLPYIISQVAARLRVQLSCT